MVPSTGEIRQAQIFVAVLRASSYTCAEASWAQSLPDWIGSHDRALSFFGGSSALWVPDNLGSAVSQASRSRLVRASSSPGRRHRTRGCRRQTRSVGGTAVPIRWRRPVDAGHRRAPPRRHPSLARSCPGWTDAGRITAQSSFSESRILLRMASIVRRFLMHVIAGPMLGATCPVADQRIGSRNRYLIPAAPTDGRIHRLSEIPRVLGAG